jgi:predicted metal-dependent peptidase
VTIYRLPEADNAGSVPLTGIDLLSPDDPHIAPLRDKDTPDAEQLAELRTGLRQQAKSHLIGRAAAYFQIECVAASAANVDWRALLRNWLHDRIKSDWSTYPYSKKYIHRGLFMPSASVESPGHIVFAIDTSGSMSTNNLNDIVAEIRAFRETFPSRLTIIQADAAIHSVTEYADFDGTDLPKSVTLQGRGIRVVGQRSLGPFHLADILH